MLSLDAIVISCYHDSSCSDDTSPPQAGPNLGPGHEGETDARVIEAWHRLGMFQEAALDVEEHYIEDEEEWGGEHEEAESSSEEEEDSLQDHIPSE